MHYEIRYKPAFASIFVTLAPGEQIIAEAGAMTSMDGALSMQTQFSGGFLPALLKRFFGGESLFVNVYTNRTQQSLPLVLTQSMIGDIHCIPIGNGVCFQPGAFIACTPGAQLGLRWAGFASFFAGEGLFKLQVTGKGHVFFGAYGGLMIKDVDGDFIVDSGHLVAYDPTIAMNLKLAGGLVGSVTSGEGLVNRLSGRGRVYLQSRSLSGLISFLRPRVR